MKIKAILLGVFILIAAGFGAMLFSQKTFHTSVLTVAEQSRNPDSFMTNVSYRELDTNGLVHVQISAPKLVHYTYKNSADFVSPDMTIYKGSKAEWKIKGDKGHSTNGLEQVELTGNVLIDHLIKSNKAPPMTMKTSKFTFYPNRDYGETDQPVIIVKMGNTIEGVGLQADLGTGNINLLSQVRAKYKKP